MAVKMCIHVHSHQSSSLIHSLLNNQLQSSSWLFIDDELLETGWCWYRYHNKMSNCSFFFFLLLLLQVVTDIYKIRRQSFSASIITIIVEIFSSISSHAHQLNSEKMLLMKLQKACSILEISEPPAVHFENESYQNYLNFLQHLIMDNPSVAEELNLEQQLVGVCEQILQIYLNCTGLQNSSQKQPSQPVAHWILPLGSAQKEELAARTSLAVSALQVLGSFGTESFRKYVSQFFPLLVDLVRCEHSSGDVQRVLCYMFQSCIGPIIMQL